MATITTASTQWASRPKDQRYLDVPSLQAAVEARKVVSREIERLPLHALGVGFDRDANNVFLKLPNMQMELSNWSFGQLCREAGAPADYMRRLPAQLSAANLQNGLRSADDSDTKVLFTNGNGYTAKAFNGTSYGRIWDADVVSALMDTVDLNRWTVPLDAYNGVNSLEATTLYASDRDIFLFLSDQTRPIEVDGQTYFRGFYTWNSEVGSATFGIAMFLYSYVCANRIIWGARDFEELRIRHTALAPGRFLAEAQPVLTAMSEASDKPVIATIRAAKQARLGTNTDEVTKALVARGFTRKETSTALALAAAGGTSGSSGDPTNVWDIVQGGTAAARSIQNADQRTAEERRWSSLLYSIKEVQPTLAVPVSTALATESSEPITLNGEFRELATAGVN